MNFELAPKETEIQANWYDAKLYCFSLNVDGKTGWRLPTKEELYEIYESMNDFEEWYYWSSTEGNSGLAWTQDMYDGFQGYYAKGDGSYYVRAIRDLT